jgi:serine/threonine protein kinase
MVGESQQRPTKTCTSCAYHADLDARFCARCGQQFAGEGSLPGELGEAVSGPRVAPAAAVPTSPSRGAADPLVGRIVADRYRIVSLLGRGGMGVVYKVEHVHIGKLMAMKLLSGELSRDPVLVRRFRSEAKAISKLAHPNTVQIFDFGESARLVYLVMEYLPGRDLGAILSADGPLPFARAARICAQVAASVGEAHERGIVHRDIKPENVMILDTSRQRDFAKVLDFGIAKLRDVEELASSTSPGNIVGTPYYMAPEQIRADAIDARTDIYALGAVLYKALTGVPPFQSGTPMGVLTMHLTQPLVPMRERAPKIELPAQAEAIVGRALQKDPARRYQTMEELREALRGALRSEDDAEPTPSGATRSVPMLGLELATRSDVDQYERRIGRTYKLGLLLAFALLLGVVYAGYLLYRREEVVSTKEKEPNDEPAQANRMVPGMEIAGQLGKRISPTYGDADVYAFEVPLDTSRAIDLRVTALPNVDVILELARKGESLPFLLVDSGRVGEPEAVPNLTLRGGSYYVRVRERFEGVRWPTENVSDGYRIGFKFLSADPGRETEPNDNAELAEKLVAGTPRHGLLGWAGDVDLYCVSAPPHAFLVKLSAAGQLDTVLRLVDRQSAFTAEANRGGPGQPESLEVQKALAEPCIEVKVHQAPGGVRADADHPYALELVARE